jgi:hypothetical protein
MKKEIKQEIDRRIQAAIKAVIEQQIAENKPPEVVETLERLQSEGFTQEESYTLIGHLVSLEVAEELVGEEGLNLDRYVVALEKLPTPFAKARNQEPEDE